ncbi:alpha/beta hydrolase [Mycolicibacterium confluentis]|nr:alpha/beta hydrolase [Mycolicibacterium confluentis]MCV7321538.1 alpha/beta hydrolase [Mycolicibacterium confluentis]
MTDVLPPPPKRRRRPPMAVLRAGSKFSASVLPVLPEIVQRGLTGFRPLVVDGNILDPTLQLFTASLRASGVPGLVLDEHNLADSRQAMLDLCVALGGPPAPVAVSGVTVPGRLEGQPDIAARHYAPNTEARNVDGPAPLVVFFHGGGYVLGGLDTYDALCRLISHDAGVHVLSVDYRLAPEHKAPAAADDAWAAYLWAVEHALALGADPARIAVAGDSAGGALAAVVAQRARDEGAPLPALQVLLYPWVDLTAPSRSRTLFADGLVLTQRDLDFCGHAYVGGSGVEVTDPRVSPARASDLSGLPPALVVTAGFDPLRDEGERYAQSLAAAGVGCDLRSMGSLVHGFVNFKAFGGACERAIDEVTLALRAHLRRA